MSGKPGPDVGEWGALVVIVLSLAVGFVSTVVVSVVKAVITKSHDV